MSTSKNESNTQQAIWSGVGGLGWVRAQSLVDQIFKPMENMVADAVRETQAQRVLDVGCGTGGTTVAATKQLPPDGYCLGIDLSQAMLDAAQNRAKRDAASAHFVCADAQTHSFECPPFDLIISRFGIMFFNDPIQAFANLRGIASDKAQLQCIAWRNPMKNPFMLVAEDAAEALLPGISKRTPNEPGQFGFADSQRVDQILTMSGWKGVKLERLDVPCSFPAIELELYLSNLGPVGRALQDANAQLRNQILKRIIPAFDRYIFDDTVKFTAACWLISAHAHD